MERRSLTNGMHAVPNADPHAVRQFVKQEPLTVESAPGASAMPMSIRAPTLTVTGNGDDKDGQAPRATCKMTPYTLVPVTVRLRPEIAVGLKRASLERQLAGEEIYTQQELVERTLEPWLKSQGYLA